DLAREGAVGAAVPVGQRAAAHDEAAAAADSRLELASEPRLAGPGGREHGHEMGRALAADALPDLREERELTRAADEGAAEVALARSGARAAGEPRLHGLRLPLRMLRLGGLVLDVVARRDVGVRADEDAVRRRRRLQPGGGVDDVARDHGLAERGPRVERDERLARVHGDPQLEVPAGDVVAHGEGGAN